MRGGAGVDATHEIAASTASPPTSTPAWQHINLARLVTLGPRRDTGGWTRQDRLIGGPMIDAVTVA